MSPHTRLRLPLLISLGLLLVFAASCSSDPEPGPRSSQRRHRGPPPTPMAGQDTFFDGQIVAELKVGAEDIPRSEPGAESSEKGGGDGSGRGRHGGGQSSDSDNEGGGRREGPRPLMGSMGPTVMIHLRFTNQGPARVELHIVDFVSPFGNFAVQPEKLALDPGQSLETEPMSSQLAGSLAETEATLVLRLADKAEKKIIILHAGPAAAKAAGAEQAPGDAPLPPKDPPAESGK